MIFFDLLKEGRRNIHDIPHYTEENDISEEATIAENLANE